MNEKLNIQNLIELLAEKHGMDKKDAESFVKEFFQLVEESLETDKYVKIKGLGTFKLINVENRESVNINTGERFEIQGHTKVSFTPEPTLKDLINKPFSHFETVVLNDKTVLEDTPMESSSEEEEEKEEENLVGQTAEMPIVASKEPVESAELPVDEVDEFIENAPTEIEEMAVEIEKVVVEEEKVAEEETIAIAEETIEVVEEIIQVVEEPGLSSDEHAAQPDGPVTELLIEQQEEDRIPTYEIPDADESAAPVDKPDSSTMKFFIGIVVLVVVLCVGAVTFMYYPDLFDRSVPPTEKVADGKTKEPASSVALTDSVVRKDTALVVKADTVAEVITPKSTEPEPVIESKPATAAPKPVAQKENPVAASKKDNKKATPFEPDSVNYKIVGTKATYTIAEGETLTKVALRFYGTKALWPYIVKYNPDVIKNPDHVPYGTVVKIPELVKK
ncbi:HU family DNA-binding protein [uncultured Bacteroides sp.]|uniref:HU family DNA-binding protein n=1 Tax=uncultured Bacteroides sp. TaxID=162156 RepID=UPI0025E90254|nr:HU family DNA-binding protein [uncultured Bacteroides sp.]